jgi:hypothetical protein
MILDFPPDTQIVLQSSKGRRSVRVNVYKPPRLAELETRGLLESKGKIEMHPVHINAHGLYFI